MSAGTNITDEHKRTFEALRDPAVGNFALFSCFVNGKPAAAIVAIKQDGEDYSIHPVFVSITDEMVLTDHEGEQPKGGV